MKKIDIDKLDIFQLSALKEIMKERTEYYAKSIPNYAMMVSDGNDITPEQKIMLDKHNQIKCKISKINHLIENYILNELFNEQD